MGLLTTALAGVFKIRKQRCIYTCSIHKYMHACMHACMHTYIHTYIHASYMYLKIYKYIEREYVHKLIIYTYICI